MTVAFIAASWLSGATPVEACSCIGSIPTCQGVWMADAVFVGRVVNITKVEDEQEPRHAFLRSRRVTLEVLEQLRGDNLLVSRDGAYEVTKVPPGRYVAAINVERDARTRQLLQPRILHPGVERASDATTIAAGPGERVKLADWSLKP